jgi:hypothetical protein
MTDFKPDDFKPAWWQLKKPIIPYRVVESILIICIMGLFTCAMVFLVNHMYEARKSSKKSQEIPMSEPKIKGKDTLPAIYAFSGTLGLLILLRVFHVTELEKDDMYGKK